MEQQKESNLTRYPNRYKLVKLSFRDTNLWGVYSFFIPKIMLSSFKEEVAQVGGILKNESLKELHYYFEGDGSVLVVHDLALPHMYKY